MTTHLFNEHNRCVSEGKNLRIIFDRARKLGGVRRINVTRLRGNPNRQALVNVFFVNGWRACTNFADFDHAVEWANAKSKRRGTWWSGCQVDIHL